MTRFFSLFCGSFFLLFSCDHAEETPEQEPIDKIMGTWSYLDDEAVEMTITFYENGRFLSARGKGRTTKGAYEVDVPTRKEVKMLNNAYRRSSANPLVEDVEIAVDVKIVLRISGDEQKTG